VASSSGNRSRSHRLSSADIQRCKHDEPADRGAVLGFDPLELGAAVTAGTIRHGRRLLDEPAETETEP
jgi:hypothetical protein